MTPAPSPSTRPAPPIPSFRPRTSWPPASRKATCGFPSASSTSTTSWKTWARPWRQHDHRPLSLQPPPPQPRGRLDASAGGRDPAFGGRSGVAAVRGRRRFPGRAGAVHARGGTLLGRSASRRGGESPGHGHSRGGGLPLHRPGAEDPRLPRGRQPRQPGMPGSPRPEGGASGCGRDLRRGAGSLQFRRP